MCRFLTNMSLRIGRRNSPSRWADRTGDDSGAGMAEYTFLLLLVAIALISAFGDFATDIETLVQRVIDAF